jgi:hypothetical protein
MRKIDLGCVRKLQYAGMKPVYARSLDVDGVWIFRKSRSVLKVRSVGSGERSIGYDSHDRRSRL